MKKFLSLVLALVMTMSLVTIGAGATEYKDLTDKDEIQYEEAVAVLNKIGVITGYTDGSFQPTGSLTRGAAAKIIVSMMIGPEAASALTVTAAPYKDVPVTNTFAAVISYCKTAGYINGYTDGTFRPTAPLTGFAFAKMLLGALGYDGKIEGFSGTGWTMNVAAIGNEAGLYNDFAETFKGNDGVTREQACQLALNTLKATMVEYVGGTSVVAGDASVTINAERKYKTSNDGKINTNISDRKTGAGSEYTTLEFGEEHFRDLKLVGNVTTDFNRPAVQWSYKNVTIGKFAYTPDFTFTAAPSGDTAKEKVKDLGLDSYKVADSATSDHGATRVSINEDDQANHFGVGSIMTATTASGVAAELVKLFGNGILVEVYLDDNTADLISDIVVIRTQLMEVNTVSSKTVTMKQLDEVGDDTDPIYTPNKYFKTTTSVKDTDDAFADLKDTKVEDYMLVTYTGSGSTKDIYSAVAPTVVTGALTGVTRNNDKVVNGVTVGGTKYKLAAIRDDDFATLTANDISATRKDVTLYLDQYGYATYIKDAGSSTNFMVYGDSYQTTVNNRNVNILTGWDMDGTAVEINIGSASAPVLTKLGQIIKYVSANSRNADYAWQDITTADVPAANKAGIVYVDYSGAYELKSNLNTINVKDFANSTSTPYVASGVKTIFIDLGDNRDVVDNIYVKNGVANVTNSELYTAPVGSNPGIPNAQAYVDKNGVVKAIVVMTTSSDVVSENVLFIESRVGDEYVNGTRTYTYHVWLNGGEMDINSTDRIDVIGGQINRFATYSENADGTYRLGAVNKTDSATSSFTLTIDISDIRTENKNLIYGVLSSTADVLKDMDGNVIASGALAGQFDTSVGINETINTTGAKFADLTDNGLSSMKNIFDYLGTASGLGKQVDLIITMNNKVGNDNRFNVSAVAVVDIH